MAVAIDALVEAVLVARGAILDLVLEQKVQGIVLDSTIQLAFVICGHWKTVHRMR